VQAVGKKSWVESCIKAATLTTDPTFSLPPLCITEIQKRRRRDQDALDEQPLRKRRWAEAMEAAGNEHRPPQSNWVEAMARTAEPILATKQNKKQEHNVHGELLKSLVELSSSFVSDKENCRPLHETETEPRKRRTRWDVQHVGSFPYLFLRFKINYSRYPKHPNGKTPILRLQVQRLARAMRSIFRKLAPEPLLCHLVHLNEFYVQPTAYLPIK
jgi:hypothetical protein